MFEMENSDKMDTLRKHLIARNYGAVEREWRTLSGNERLSLMKFCYERGIDRFIGEEHFKTWWPDKALLLGTAQIGDKQENVKPYQGIIYELAEIFGLSVGQVDNFVRNGFRGERFEKRETVRDVALYTRFFNYKELVENKDFYFLTYELLGKYPRIFKCEPKRTEARLKFLMEHGKIILDQAGDGSWIIENEEEMMADLVAKTSNFNLKHQAALERKINSFYAIENRKVEENMTSDKNEDYKALASMVGENQRKKNTFKMLAEDVPDYAYDKFLELAMRAMYGDEKLLRDIEERKMLLDRIKVSEQRIAENNQNRELNMNSTDEDILELPEDPEVKELFTVLITDFQEGTKQGGRGRGEPSDGRYELPIDEEAINAYLEEAKRMGLESEGYIQFVGGRKARNEDYVRDYVFKHGKYRILEPIGQIGNATYIIPVEEGVDFETLLQEHTKTELIAMEKAICVYHSRHTKVYDYSPMRIKNLIHLIDEGRKQVSHTWSREQLQDQITELVPATEIPQVIQYVTELGENVNGLTEFSRERAKRIKDKVRRMEERAIANTQTDTLASDGEEVDI